MKGRRRYTVMMIKKVEELVGIDRETIRFYIREGLLAPEQLKIVTENTQRTTSVR